MTEAELIAAAAEAAAAGAPADFYGVDPQLAHLTPDELAALNVATAAYLDAADPDDDEPELHPPAESDEGIDGGRDGRRKPAGPCPDPIHVRPVYGSAGAGPIAGPTAAIRCWRWSCESCGPRRRVEVLKQVRLGADVSHDQPLRFLTVTFPRDVGATFDRAGVAEVNERFRRFIQQLRRQHISAEYAKTLETTKRGRLHVHAILRGSYLPKCTHAARRRHGLDPKSGECVCYGSTAAATCRNPKCRDLRAHGRRCIQRIAWDMGLGFVEVRKITSREAAAAYVAKYLTKASPNVHNGRPWPKYARRYTASRRWASKTLGQIHREYVDDLRRRGVIPEPDPSVVGWIRATDPAELAAAARGGHLHDQPGRPPPFRVAPVRSGFTLDRATGELAATLPVPF